MEILHLVFYLIAISVLEEHENTYKPVGIYASRAYKQTITDKLAFQGCGHEYD
jgi:hypothetical protein